MKQNEKILIGVLILILVVVLVVVAVNKGNNKEKNEMLANNEQNIVENNVQILENGTKLNTSSELAEERTIDGLEVSNIKLKENGGISALTADIKNPTAQDKESIKVKVEILDGTGKTITTLRGKIDPVKAGKTAKLNIAVTADVANAHDFKITKE